MELSPGTMVTPNVRLVELLGEGGMGSVWVADHLTLDSQVAVKFIAAELLGEGGQEVLTRFKREAKAAAKIKSPHVVQVHDQGVMGDGTPYIVMELLAGESLAGRLERTGAVPLGEVAVFMRQVAKVLTEAHQQDIIHRDIKPDNVFLSRAGDEIFVKVLDFGIAKLAPKEAGSVVTVTGAMVGTPQYSSPEQMLNAADVTCQTDLWSLGVMTYELLTGQLPFPSDDSVRQLMAMVNGDFKMPSVLFPELGPAFDAWFARALARYPDQRFESAAEMVDEFDKVVASLTPEATATAGGGQSAADVARSVGAAQPPAPGASGPRGHSPVASAPTQAAPTLPIAAPSAPGQDGLASPAGAAPQPAVTGPSPKVGTLAGATSSRRAARGNRLKLVVGAAVLAGVAAVATSILWLSVPGSESEATVATPTADELGPPTSATAAPPTVVPEGMVVIAGGTYPVGCDEGHNQDCWADEKPRHEVTVPPYAIMRHEVTVALYQECLAASACPLPAKRDGCVLGDWAGSKLPVNCVAWKAAEAFCAHRGWRLPSETEWEIAARGAELPDYPWGNQAPSCEQTVMADGTSGGCGTGGPLPVGSKGADESWANVQDLGGSLREWTATPYAAYPQGEADEANLNKIVTRGGSWIMKPGEVATSHTRGTESPEVFRTDLGFRCAMDL